MALVMGIAPILAPSIGALINHALGWRAIFGALVLGNVICLSLIALLLPETNTTRAPALRLGRVLSSYGSLLKNKQFVGYLLPDAAVRAGMFAYIAGSPFVFIELFHIPKEHYGWIFGTNGIGLILASQINRRLLRRWEPDVILRWSVRLAAVASICVFAGALIGAWPLLTLVPLFFFVASLNFVSPNSLAGALASQGHQAGTASALYGCMQWSLASSSAFLVSYFHDGTALPMTGVILLCGLVSTVAYQTLVRARLA
jgi:DHA1 family bicyclomycin/chloramphenicol resistance-like MFS transporter